MPGILSWFWGWNLAVFPLAYKHLSNWAPSLRHIPVSHLLPWDNLSGKTWSSQYSPVLPTELPLPHLLPWDTLTLGNLPSKRYSPSQHSSWNRTCFLSCHYWEERPIDPLFTVIPKVYHWAYTNKRTHGDLDIDSWLWAGLAREK